MMKNNLNYIKQKQQSKPKLNAIYLAVLASFVTPGVMAAPAVWMQEVTGGEVRFYDWGYSGPQGQNAMQYDYNGFGTATQIQRVVTLGPDRLTPDAPTTIPEDLNYDTLYWDSNMDSQTNFYDWGYTSPAGSTFSNMQIDADGDYHIARNDMAFEWYGEWDYQYEATTYPDVSDATTLYAGVPDGVYDTNIQFQPYALSDATGWCGSVTASNPTALEAMAGQVTFDFGFEAFLPTTGTGDNGVWDPGEGSMQIVQRFEMRSYGSLEVDLDATYFQSDAVVNNTNPLDSPVVRDALGDEVMIEVPVLNMDGTAALDADGNPRFQLMPDMTVGLTGVDANYNNLVSFMGGGVVPAGVWVEWLDPTLPKSNDNLVAVLDVTDIVDADGDGVDDNNPNIVYHQNSFGGYGFLLRADGIRIVEGLDFSLYSDISNVLLKDDVNGNGIYDEGDTVYSTDYDYTTDIYSTIVVQDLSAVPVPAAVWLFGSGLLALVGFSRRKKSVQIIFY